MTAPPPGPAGAWCPVCGLYWHVRGCTANRCNDDGPQVEHRRRLARGGVVVPPIVGTMGADGVLVAEKLSPQELLRRTDPVTPCECCGDPGDSGYMPYGIYCKPCGDDVTHPTGTGACYVEDGREHRARSHLAGEAGKEGP